MLRLSLLGLATVSATVVIHAIGTTWWIRRLLDRSRERSGGEPSRFAGVLGILVKTTLLLVALHVVEVVLWAGVLRHLPDSGLASFEEAVYLSFVTFTTLGYGDVTVGGPWRLMAGIEALNGIILLGWSTALSFAVISRIWEALASSGRDKR